MGARQPVPRESAYKPCKPSRGEGRACSARPVVTAACFLFCRRATGAASARPSLRPQFIQEGGDVVNNPGETCRGTEGACAMCDERNLSQPAACMKNGSCATCVSRVPRNHSSPLPWWERVDRRRGRGGETGEGSVSADADPHTPRFARYPLSQGERIDRLRGDISHRSKVWLCG